MDIELRHIHKWFGSVHANDDISLTFRSGRIVGILGENGAGKSTLMKILSGFQAMDSGEIRLNGESVAYHNPQAAIAHGIGMLQQDPLDVPAFSVMENFLYGQLQRDVSGARGSQPLPYKGLFEIFGLNRKDALKQLTSLCHRFGFALDPDTPIAQLSIAQRQQLEIVRLLALGVKTLILDEPTTGISAEQKAILFDALRELAANDSMTVLLVSHKLEDVIALCHEVAVLRAGKVVGTREMPATTRQLVTMMFGQELTPHTRSLLHLENAPVVLSLESIYLHGKRVMVENLSLDVKAGEIIGLAGLDGSGQELLLRACVGLEWPVAGNIVLKGVNMTPHHGIRLDSRQPVTWLERIAGMGGRIGRLLAAVYGLFFFLISIPLSLASNVSASNQNYRRFLHRGVAFGAAGRLEEGLVGGLTLTEHMALVRETGALVDWARAQQQTEAQIQHYNVRGRPDSPIETLSGGNQQRMLMALMPQNPVLMVLEQPTRGLDVDSARWIWQQLLERREGGTAILFSSPDLDELVAYSDRILVFYAGRAHEIPDARQTTIDQLGRLVGGHFEEGST